MTAEKRHLTRDAFFDPLAQLYLFGKLNVILQYQKAEDIGASGADFHKKYNQNVII